MSRTTRFLKIAIGISSLAAILFIFLPSLDPIGSSASQLFNENFFVTLSFMLGLQLINLLLLRFSNKAAKIAGIIINILLGFGALSTFAAYLFLRGATFVTFGILLTTIGFIVAFGLNALISTRPTPSFQ
ncbi:hypothetical protein FC83_GL002917 [Agrilactobacillus composti DSM 18527 = JCM 14202]|uniref:Uncharacterized protein n=1 Tax=Agrilactobacillus composti DSM 18527 = JCM 14202 TaxID=1423734 RepID=X0PS14_9LACO|nr:hypothetical protein [Agrilactobacillus composti]KRM33349.1 hypothetical protein FC83_GL002917 [Agrilactobacillus composti DSM 18527 = JCM 14202]GAF40667.1 hypothetical protein JCM14202_2573 [Agrilactobacillus composti DSM 18527 = JCM 14202]